VPTPTRRLALQILARAESGRTTLADLLATAEAEALPPRERAFLHELVLGTLRRRGGLDHALKPLLDRPLRELDVPVRTALRLGAYQILHLRVPGRAAVSEAVDLVRDRSRKAGGFVNAVLRQLLRVGPPAEADPERDPLAWLTTSGSLPVWLAERWLRRLGPAAAVSRARAFLEPPPVFFRLNPRLGDAHARAQAALTLRPLAVPGGWEALEGRWAELAAAGVLYVQDQGSQMVAHLAARPGRVLDACAAPGGKALLIGDLGQGVVVAGEAAPRRLRTLAALCRRWGATNVLPLGADARRPPFRAAFDTVLLDAPCTGLGTLGRHPDIRWRLRPADIPRQAHRQKELLESVAPIVKPGGALVYATCSVEDEENEGVIAPFLASHPGFAPASLPAWAAPFADGPFLRLRPERDRGDAFFAALLRRSAGSGP
jgi:16S rRNA (cytosine967-C5)-methyltransferase